MDFADVVVVVVVVVVVIVVVVVVCSVVCSNGLGHINITALYYNAP